MEVKALARTTFLRLHFSDNRKSLLKNTELGKIQEEISTEILTYLFNRTIPVNIIKNFYEVEITQNGAN